MLTKKPKSEKFKKSITPNVKPFSLSKGLLKSSLQYRLEKPITEEEKSSQYKYSMCASFHHLTDSVVKWLSSLATNPEVAGSNPVYIYFNFRYF